MKTSEPTPKEFAWIGISLSILLIVFFYFADVPAFLMTAALWLAGAMVLASALILLGEWYMSTLKAKSLDHALQCVRTEVENHFAALYEQRGGYLWRSSATDFVEKHVPSNVYALLLTEKGHGGIADYVEGLVAQYAESRKQDETDPAPQLLSHRPSEELLDHQEDADQDSAPYQSAAHPIAAGGSHMPEDYVANLESLIESGALPEAACNVAMKYYTDPLSIDARQILKRIASRSIDTGDWDLLNLFYPTGTLFTRVEIALDESARENCAPLLLDSLRAAIGDITEASRLSTVFSQLDQWCSSEKKETGRGVHFSPVFRDCFLGGVISPLIAQAFTLTARELVFEILMADFIYPPTRLPEELETAIFLNPLNAILASVEQSQDHLSIAPLAKYIFRKAFPYTEQIPPSSDSSLVARVRSREETRLPLPLASARLTDWIVDRARATGDLRLLASLVEGDVFPRRLLDDLADMMYQAAQERGGTKAVLGFFSSPYKRYEGLALLLFKDAQRFVEASNRGVDGYFPEADEATRLIVKDEEAPIFEAFSRSLKYFHKLAKDGKPLLALHLLNGKFLGMFSFGSHRRSRDKKTICDCYIACFVALERFDILEKYYEEVEGLSLDLGFLEQLARYFLSNKLASKAAEVCTQIRDLEPTHPFLRSAWEEIDRCRLVESLAAQNLDAEALNALSGEEFEALLIRRFRELGFDAKETPASGDFGADIILENGDQTRFVLQCKRFRSKVNLKAVQEVVAALAHFNGDIGIVITNNSFLNSAVKLAESNDIELWDGIKLMKFLAGDLSFSALGEGMNGQD